MRKLSILILLLIALMTSTEALGDIVSTSFSGNVSSTTGATQVTDSSSIFNDAISVRADFENSFTETSLTWGWDGSELVGTGLATAAKTQNAKPGQDHIGDTELCFEFTINSQMTFNTSGTFGFDNTNAAGDSLSMSLLNSGDGTTVFFASTTSIGGVASDSWSGSGLLDTGSYKLAVNTLLTETISQTNMTLAGWDMTSFKLTNAAVPEANPRLVIFACFGFMFMGRKKRAICEN